MALALIAAVIVLPIVELMVLFKIGNAIGLLPLLFLLVAMALIGGLVLRRQGMVVARRALEQVSRNEPPVESMIDGIGLSLAGFLFILPGILSDVAGLLLLVPAIRRPLVGRVLGLAVVRWRPRGGGRGPGGPGGRPGAGPPPGQSPHASQPSGRPPDGVVIDGEFERLDERTIRPGRGTPGDQSASRK